MPKTLIRAASPIAIEESLRTVADRMRRWKRWLNSRHPYNSNVVNTLRRQGDIDGPKLGEYIASSAPLHLADGWTFLSRAFDAVSRGDRGSTYHLAYYAELRAAMSLLATEGVGIFSNRHVALNDRLEPTELKRRRGTHRATWQLLSAWSREPGRAVRLLDAITVESVSLSEWLDAVGVVEPSKQLVAAKWLSAWSVDLRTMSTDPRRRNEMSYRPSRIQSPSPQSVKARSEIANPVFACWEELDPELAWAHAALDLSLLRRAIRLAIQEGLCNYSALNQALNSLAGEMSPLTLSQLRFESRSAATIFHQAEISNVRGTAVTPILARSLLMLRLASASTASLLNAADVSKQDLEFWWSPMGTDLGWWDSSSEVETFSDLWADVAEARDDASADMTTVSGEGSVRIVADYINQDVAITQFSRAPMWLLGLD